VSGLAEEEVEQAAWVVWARRVGGALLLVVALGGVVLLARELGSSPGPQQRQMAKIRIVPETPPPPPPPREEPKREPPKDVKEVKVEQPRQAPPAPTEQLKMEGEASDNGVAGLIAGSVTRDYAGGPLGGSRFAWYGDLMQQEVRQVLAKNPKLRSGDYTVVVKIWVTSEGRVSRVELVSGSGKGDTDDLIRAALAELPPMRERPPEDMPWPVKLRVTSRS
jgi:TonB family protein